MEKPYVALYSHSEQEVQEAMNTLSTDSRCEALAYLDHYTEERNAEIFAAERADDEYN
jgi:hypothetical protein